MILKIVSKYDNSNAIFYDISRTDRNLFESGSWGLQSVFQFCSHPLIWLNFKTADMMNEIYNEQNYRAAETGLLRTALTEKDHCLS